MRQEILAQTRAALGSCPWPPGLAITEAKFCIYENFGYVRITLNCSYTKKIVIIVRLSKSMNLMREEKLRKVVFSHYECTEPQKIYRLW